MTLPADLAAVLAESWALLMRGATDRRSAAHTPIVATVDGDGHPDQRVMVLRDVCGDTRRLRFHTDARSPKCAQLVSGAAAHVLVYDPAAKLQLRIGGHASVHTEGRPSMRHGPRQPTLRGAVT